MGQRSFDRQGLLGYHLDAPEDQSESLNLLLGPVAEVGQGPFADLVSLPPALPQEDGWWRVAVGHAIKVRGHDYAIAKSPVRTKRRTHRYIRKSKQTTLAETKRLMPDNQQTLGGGLRVSAPRSDSTAPFPFTASFRSIIFTSPPPCSVFLNKLTFEHLIHKGQDIEEVVIAVTIHVTGPLFVRGGWRRAEQDDVHQAEDIHEVNVPIAIQVARRGA